MISLSTQLAVAVVTATLSGVLSSDLSGRAAPDDVGPTASAPTTPLPTDPPGSSIWLALYSSQGGPAQFISIDEQRGTLYVEATSPNLEIASVVKVARGLLNAEILRRLREALRVLKRTDPVAIAAMRPIEPIEQDGRLANVATCADRKISSWFGLAAKAMPLQVSEALDDAAAAASKLGSHVPPSLVQVTPVEKRRAEKIRSDTRAFYTVVSIREDLIDSLPHLRAAFRCPGSVVETDERENGLVRKWLRLANPKSMGNTLFLQVEGDAVRGVFQLHVPAARPAP